MMEHLNNGNQISVAATCLATRTLGPGLRSVLWVQGCLKRCRGCNTPEMSDVISKNLQTPEQLAERLLSVPGIEGLTLSGGEPMLQAAGLARMVIHARTLDPALNVICYSGFTLQQLTRAKHQPGVADLLAEIDVLIDGEYEIAAHEQNGLCGSSNQNVYYLSERLKGVALDAQPRWTEVRVLEGELALVGSTPGYVRHWFNSVAPRRPEVFVREAL